MTVSFITPGTIDLENVFTFGMSAKGSEDSIGFFGTGLKFAIATLLRTGHGVSLWIGETRHIFRTEPTNFRGKDFSKVYLDDKPLNFTTELGKTWEVWMAFRELHSNTLDEKGRTQHGMFMPAPDESAIIVTGTGIDQSISDISLIFCDSPIICANDKLEIRTGRSPFLFYKGVRVLKLGSSSLFTYNILDRQDLTEDRTIKYEYTVRMHLAHEVAKMGDASVLQRVLTAPEGSHEHNMDFDGVTPSDTFTGVLKDCYRDAFLNESARKLAKTLNLFVEEEFELDEIQHQQMLKAVGFLQVLGFNVTEYPIKFIKLHGLMGAAKSGVIYIDPVAFRMGTKQLAGTLFEEWFHLSEGCRDETRTMQNFLIDTIMTMGEKITGYPI